MIAMASQIAGVSTVLVEINETLKFRVTVLCEGSILLKMG